MTISTGNKFFELVHYVCKKTIEKTVIKEVLLAFRGTVEPRLSDTRLSVPSIIWNDIQNF